MAREWCAAARPRSSRARCRASASACAVRGATVSTTTLSCSRCWNPPARAAGWAEKQPGPPEPLARVACVEPARWLAPLAGPVWAYRRRARLGVKFVRKKGCVVVGFRERAAAYVAQLTRCEVLAAPVGELIAPLAAMLNELSIRERVPQIEVAVADHATALVLRVLSAPSEADAARLRQFGAAYGVRLYLQPAGLDSVVAL